MLKAYFRLSLRFVRSALCAVSASVSKLASFAPKHVMAHEHVESEAVERKRTVQERERLAVQDKGVRANRRCSTFNPELECWLPGCLLRLLRKVPFFRLMRLIE